MEKGARRSKSFIHRSGEETNTGKNQGYGNTGDQRKRRFGKRHSGQKEMFDNLWIEGEEKFK